MLKVGYKKIFLMQLTFSFLFIFSVSAYCKPVIFYTDILSGPNSGTNDGPGGCYLTIFGKGFGAGKGTSRITVGGSEVGAYKYWSDTRVSVQLGPQNHSGDIVVTTSGGSATAPDQFTVRDGDIYFVSLTGNDSTGVVNDINHPYHDPQYVESLSNFGPGDFIVVRGGTYDLDDGTYQMKSSRWIYPRKSGTDGYPLTFYGYPESDGTFPNVRIDHPGHRLWSNYTIVSNWVVANFEVSLSVCDPSRPANFIGVGRPAAACPAGYTFSNGRFVNIDAHGGCGSTVQGSDGIAVARVENVKLLGISVHDHRDGGAITDHPIYLSAEQRNVEVGWCSVYNIARSRALIQVHTDSFSGTCYGSKTITDIYIHDCVIHDVNGQAILIGGGTGDVFLYNNVIYNTPYSRIDPWTYDDVISLRADGGAAHIRMYNNIIYGNPRVDGSGELLGIGPVVGSSNVRLTLFNNIFYVADSSDQYYTYHTGKASNYNITSDNNVWYGSSSGLPPFAGPNDRVVDPKFVNPAGHDFHLKSDSPCIDRGSSVPGSLVKRDFDGITRPQGTAIDIGAYEYDGAPSTALPPPSTITATAANSIDLSWSSVSGAVGYNVYRSTTSGSGYVKINGSTPVTGTSFVDQNTTPGTTYYYVVTSVNSAGQESVYSSEASATEPLGNGAPSIGSFTADPNPADNPKRNISFVVQASDPDGDALSYTIDFGDGSAAASASTAEHAYTSKGTYTATVTVSDDHDHSISKTLQITVNDAVPTKPTNVSAN